MPSWGVLRGRRLARSSAHESGSYLDASACIGGIERLEFCDPFMTERRPPVHGGFMELAGLEPATSWVRSSRSFTLKVPRLQRFMGKRWSATTSPPTVCTASCRHGIRDTSVGAIEEERGRAPPGKRGRRFESALQKRPKAV